MKNKKLIYILIPLTVIIWGVIVYRIISQIRRNPEPVYNKTDMIDGFQSKQPSDTFTLKLDYTDPFLDRNLRGRPSIRSAYERQDNPVPAPATSVTKPQSTDQTVLWPVIRYGGIIENTDSKQEICLVNIDGINFLMSTGDTKEQVKLIKVYQDSIILELTRQRRTFYKRTL